MRETTRHREAYAAYLALGAERSIERLHAELAAAGRTPSLRTLYEWSRCFHWQDRLAAFEHRARAAAEEAELEAIREMHARQVSEALLLQQRGRRLAAGRRGRRGVAGGGDPGDHGGGQTGTPRAGRAHRTDGGRRRNDGPRGRTR